MRRRLAASALLGLMTLTSVMSWGDDREPPADPDPSFLEFLGSVDRLAEVNPDYLTQQPGRPPTTAPPKVASPPPPPPPPPTSRMSSND